MKLPFSLISILQLNNTFYAPLYLPCSYPMFNTLLTTIDPKYLKANLVSLGHYLCF